MRPIDADALIEKCGGWYVDECTESGFIGTLENLLATEPTIQPQSTTGQLNDGAQSTDLIDRQAAIDAIENSSKPYVWQGADIIRRLPTVQPEPQWIPVERELPEDFTDVLVWFEYFRYGDYNCLYQTHGIGTYVANYNLWTVNHETGWKDLRVIAWMPLPELYKPNK